MTDDVEDDDVEKGMMRMLRMMVLRKRKMMMLMMIMMWRSRTEPKTATTVFVQACAVEMHLDMSKSHFTREFTQKKPQTRWIPRPRPTLCASLRSRHALGHVTTAILCENLKIKCRRPDGSQDHGVTHHFRQ